MMIFYRKTFGSNFGGFGIMHIWHRCDGGNERNDTTTVQHGSERSTPSPMMMRPGDRK